MNNRYFKKHAHARPSLMYFFYLSNGARGR